MARGNWSIYKPKPRCRICGVAIRGEVKKVAGKFGDIPACPACAKKIAQKTDVKSEAQCTHITDSK